MVSTRGGTRTTGADAGTESTLRKKPVRQAPTKTTQAESKAKTTRSKKAEPEPEQLGDDDEDEIQVAGPPPNTTRRGPAARPEPTKRAATRPKKDEEPLKEAAPKPAPKITKAASSTKTARSKATENGKPELPPPAPTQAKATRATRATRATAAKEKATPLSPKKITQVSKAPPKTTRTASKAKAPVTQSRPATRKRRNVSDENADVLALSPSNDETEDENTVKSKHNKTSRAKSTSVSARKLSVVEDETPASSRPTTPSDGVAQSFNDPDEETAEATEQEDSESEEGDYTNNTSHDELCGPKTPMKRSSPRFSPQKNSQSLDLGVPSKTPVRRFAVLGTQQGTPQTTKPYRKPNVPLSAVRPTTVARARDRAMVFPRLQPLALEAEESQDDQSDSVEDKGTPMPVDMEALGAEPDVNVEDTTSDVEDTTPDSQLVENSSAVPDRASHVDDVVMHEDNGVVESMSEDQDFAEQTLDMEETVVHQDEELESAPNSATEASFDSNDSVIVTRQAIALETDSELDEQMQLEMPAGTPTPETLIWENIRQDVTIPFDFDVDMTLSRSLPQVEHNDRLSIANEFTRIFQDEPDAVAGASETEDTSEDAHMHQESNAVAEAPEQSIVSSRESLDATVNLSDFIDVKSLSESRRQSKAVDTAVIDDLKGGNEDVGEAHGQTSASRAITTPAKDMFEFEVAMDESPDETQLAPEEQTATIPIPSTPARDVSELDIALSDLQQPPAPNTPRYALPTISSRRKSLPAKLYPGTLSVEISRPQTSDGAGIQSIATPSRASIRPRAPFISRPTTSLGRISPAKQRAPGWTPRASKTPMAKTPGTSVPLNWQTAAKKGTPSTKTPIPRTLFASTPGTSVPETTGQAARDRFPGMPSRNTYKLDDVVETASANTTVNHALPEERFPGLPSRGEYDIGRETPSSGNTPVSAVATVVKSASQERFPGLPPMETYEELATTSKQEDAEELSTPRPAAADRYPGLPHRRTYEEHAKTAMPAYRSRTPTHSPAKRPATVQKQASLRKVALEASTPTASRAPMKTPLKAPAFTPGQVPMTPHPAAPLRGVVALVEVYTSDGDCATPAFAALLQRLGAKTTKTFSERVTHVVYKEGSPNTLTRLRIHNKQVAENGRGKEIHCVNSRWVTDCDAQGSRMPESDEAYAVEVDDVPRTAKRRRKSMEPMSLTNIKGSVFRDRKSSLGRSSLGRSPLKMDSPPEEDKTSVNMEDKENSGDHGSPATPAYLAAPSSLVQQTAPLNKVRKLDFKSSGAAKNRRLTFWNGGA